MIKNPGLYLLQVRLAMIDVLTCHLKAINKLLKLTYNDKDYYEIYTLNILFDYYERLNTSNSVHSGSLQRKELS